MPDELIPLRRVSSAQLAWVWFGVAILVAIGLSAAMLRGIFLEDLATRLEPFRQGAFQATGLADPHLAERAAEVQRLDERFPAHPTATALHLIPASAFLLLCVGQFTARIRDRYRTYHRWAGRTAVSMGLVSGLAGLYFGVAHPYAGMAERVTIITFGGFFVVALAIGLARARARRFAVHREWMIRAFAAALGISTIRLLAPFVDLALTPLGVGSEALLVTSFWIGWCVTLAAAEGWVRYTRSA